MGFFSGLNFGGLVDSIGILGNTYNDIFNSGNNSIPTSETLPTGTLPNTGSSTSSSQVSTTSLPVTTSNVVPNKDGFVKKYWMYFLSGAVLLVALVYWFKGSKKNRR